jgi:hypothetical protein
LIFLVVFVVAYIGLLGMFPLWPATLSASEVAARYAEHSMSIRLGAVLCSWTAAFQVPMAVAIAVQMARLEKGFPIWATLQLVGGCLATIFAVLPPILWGTAAFSPERTADATNMLHELANIAFITTDQYFIFQFIPIAVMCLARTQDALSPFPRWFGYLTIWAALIIEVGVVGYLTRVGPFAWNGLFVFWIPLNAFFTWFGILAVLLIRSIKRQARLQGSPPLAVSGDGHR